MVFKYSFNSTPFHTLPLEEVVSKLEREGYDAIELNASITPNEEPHVPLNLDEQEASRIVNIMEKSNLDVSSISAHYDLIHSNPEEREKAMKYTKQCIKLAADLNKTIVHGYSGNKPSSMSDEEAWKILSESINEIIEYANQEGVKYAFEPAARRFINNGDKIKQLKSKISTGMLYVNLDPGNLTVAGDSVKEFIYTFKEEIVHVHMKEGRLIDGEVEFPPLGQGDVDFQEMLKALEDIGYESYLSVEYEADRFGYKEATKTIPVSSLEFMKSIPVGT